MISRVIYRKRNKEAQKETKCSRSNRGQDAVRRRLRKQDEFIDDSLLQTRK